jgi:hypothetical protein
MPRPGDFPIGSLESRMAMRAALKERGDGVSTVVIGTGLAACFAGQPSITPPDSVAHYEAPDGSIVQVICRGVGEITAYVNQYWKDGSAYDGKHELEDFGDLGKLTRPIPLEKSVWQRGKARKVNHDGT